MRRAFMCAIVMVFLSSVAWAGDIPSVAPGISKKRPPVVTPGPIRKPDVQAYSCYHSSNECFCSSKTDCDLLRNSGVCKRWVTEGGCSAGSTSCKCSTQAAPSQ